MTTFVRSIGRRYFKKGASWEKKLTKLQNIRAFSLEFIVINILRTFDTR